MDGKPPEADTRFERIESRLARLELQLFRLENRLARLDREWPSAAPAPTEAPSTARATGPWLPPELPATPVAATQPPRSAGPVRVHPALTADSVPAARPPLAAPPLAAPPVSAPPVSAPPALSTSNAPPRSPRALWAPGALSQAGPAAPVDRGPAPAPPASAGPSFADLELRLTGRLLAWVGGAALLIGIAFLLSLAFSRGWIGPEARVVAGFAAGVVLMAGGAWSFDRHQPLFGHVLTAVGLGAISLALFAATRLYGLIPPEIGLAATLVTAIGAAAIAVRADSQAVAAYGLAAVLVAPPILGAPATIVTIGYLATLLVGTTLIALARTWSWLPPLAFLLSAPQLVAWLVSDPLQATALVSLAGFWMLNLLAAGGEEYRRPGNLLRGPTVSLVLLNAVFVAGSGLYVLRDEPSVVRGALLVALALGHFTVGGWFLWRRGEIHPFGMLVTGVGIAALTLAVPIALNGPAVALGWTAEATVLAWIHGWRSHRFAGLAAIAMGGLAIGHLIAIELPVHDLGPLLTGELTPTAGAVPFVSGAGLALVCLLAALAFSGVVVAAPPVRLSLAALGLLLVAYAMPFEVDRLPLVGGLSVLAVGAVVAETPIVERVPGPTTATLLAWTRVLYGPALAAMALALVTLASVELPVALLGNVALPATPFVDEGAIAGAIIIAAAAAIAVATPDRDVRVTGVVLATSVAAYLALFELPIAGVVVFWSALAIVQFGVARWDRGLGRACERGWTVLVGLGLLGTLAEIAPPDRLGVREWVPASEWASIQHPPFVSAATVALGAVIVALLAGMRELRARPWSIRLGVAAAGLGVYLLSIGVVDEFAARVGGPMAIEELQKQAQVALSILWAILGVAALIAGIRLANATARHLGLALLALATVKVFVVDLAALDVAYRVLSFIGLGVLLLISAYAFQSLRPRPGGRGGTAAVH